MGRRVVLHIGAMKTGTSYVQSVLGSNKDEIAAPASSSWVASPARPRPCATSSSLPKDERRNRRRWEKIARAAHEMDGHTGVVSMEFLSFAAPAPRGGLPGAPRGARRPGPADRARPVPRGAGPVADLHPQPRHRRLVDLPARHRGPGARRGARLAGPPHLPPRPGRRDDRRALVGAARCRASTSSPCRRPRRRATSCGAASPRPPGSDPDVADLGGVDGQRVARLRRVRLAAPRQPAPRRPGAAQLPAPGATAGPRGPRPAARRAGPPAARRPGGRLGARSATRSCAASSPRAGSALVGDLDDLPVPDDLSGSPRAGARRRRPTRCCAARRSCTSTPSRSRGGAARGPGPTATTSTPWSATRSPACAATRDEEDAMSTPDVLEAHADDEGVRRRLPRGAQDRPVDLRPRRAAHRLVLAGARHRRARGCSASGRGRRRCARTSSVAPGCRWSTTPAPSELFAARRRAGRAGAIPEQRIVVADAQGNPLGLDKSMRLMRLFADRSAEHLDPLLDSIEDVLAALRSCGVAGLHRLRHPARRGAPGRLHRPRLRRRPRLRQRPRPPRRRGARVLPAPARAGRHGLPRHPLLGPGVQDLRPGVRRHPTRASTSSAASCARACST